MVQDKKASLPRNFMKQLSRGMVKSLPVVGIFFEQIIYGTIDAEVAQKEVEKLYSTLSEISNKLKGYDINFGNILYALEKRATFCEEFKAELSKIIALLENPDSASIPNSLENAVEYVLSSGIELADLINKIAAMHPSDLGTIIASFPEAGPYIATNMGSRQQANELVTWANRQHPSRILDVIETVRKLDPNFSVTISNRLTRIPTKESSVSQLKVPLYSNIPSQICHFVGRTEEFERAVGILRKNQPFVISGMPGIGKTSLALEIAHHFSGENLMPGGAYWCSIGLEAGLEQTIQIIARQMNVTDIAHCDPEQRLPVLANHVRERRALLILDNVFDKRVLKSVLRNFRGTAVLLTTRVRNLPGDLIKLRKQTCDLAGLSADESQKLLIMVSGEDETRLENEDTAEVKAICEHMEYHPMAITAAGVSKASWKVDFKTVRERLHTILRKQIVNLEGGTVPESTVLLMIESNYEQLRDTSQFALCTASVFRGSFCTEAFNEVMQCSSTQLARGFLQELLEISLINHVGNERFRLHDLTRRLACQKLEETDEKAIVVERYVKYYCSFVESVKATTNEFAYESQNIFAAFEYSYEAKNARGCVTLAKALSLYLTGASIEELDLDLQEATKLELQCRLWQQCVDLCHTSGSRLLAYALWRYSSSLWSVSKFPESEKALNQALQEAVKDHDTKTEAACLCSLASRLCRKKKPPKEAEALAKKALRKATKINDVRTEGMCLHRLGWIYTHQGKSEKGVDKFNKALTRLQTAGSVDEIMGSLNGLGYALTELGKFDEAKRVMEEGLDLVTSAGSRRALASCLFRLGSILDHVRQFEEALRYYEQSLDIRKTIGDTNNVGTCFHAIGYCKFHLEQYEEAEHLFQQSLEIKKKRDDVRGVAPPLEFLARLAAKQGDMKKAKKYAIKSLKLYESLGSPQAKGVKKLLAECSTVE